jgi:hypothetical protein
MKITSPLSLLALLALLFSFTQSDRVFGTPASVAQQNIRVNTVRSSPVLGYIQTRNGRIAIGADSTYTIYNQDGKVLFENITLEQLQAENPELHDVLRRSIAEETLMMDIRTGDEQ